MPDTRQTQKNAVPNQSDGNIEDAIWRLKINDNQEGGGVAQSNVLPDRPGEPDCIFYLRTGSCGYGNNCRFNHPAYASQGAQFNGDLPERVGQPDCGYFLKTGTCKYGSTCKFHHPRDRRGAGPVSFNILGFPMRQEEKSCPYYMRTGSCKFGAACKFHHPQPASLGTVFPAPPPAFGSAGSAVLPSSNLPYAGGLPAWSFPRVPYVPGPQPQQQPYVPVVISPSQGIISAGGWNTYVGNVSPVPSTGIVGSNLVYNPRNPVESGSAGQMHLLSNSGLSLPERPDQPECRYFMSTGNCKYGTDCKYHHPKERNAQSASNPLGLPSRPGQAVCSYYSMYGICKYGPTCKFDHPPLSYPYNYGLSLPAMLDSPFLSHQRSFATVPTIETSHSIPAKSFDVVQKPLKNKSWNSETRLSEDSSKHVGSLVHTPPSSEASEDQSG
ncbi:Zinc finger CCCH domain-containing protein 3 [Morus notabilis]|uniref:Zinc finger CCCH domain-containing protein 3 n=1 Tax=Morus notabilis TaxID=981085 RepID=W9SF52_9ROSA|nr:zinc finger CCCH domain-containing protein 3 [Morus notabilis]EXC25517.1 Zinc finger CCCH domain-containing protein 3 [Morus notabilis]